MFIKFKNAQSEICRGADLIINADEIRGITQLSYDNKWRVFTKSFGDFTIEGVSEKYLANQLKPVEIEGTSSNDNDPKAVKKMLKKYL